MSSEYNKLLERQVREHLLKTTVTPELEAFLASISSTYDDFEMDRDLLERTMLKTSEEMEESNSQLRAKNETLDSFVYRVSHDLKAPANNLVSMLAMLEEFIDKEGRAPLLQRIMTNLDTAGRSMQIRIGDLLKMTRIEHQVAEPPVRVHLTGLVDEIVRSMDAEVRASGANVHIDFAEVDHVMFGRENIASIFSNLIGNAVKYHHPERIPEIQICGVQKDDKFLLSIADNGIGMDLENNGNRMFDMFSRMHSHVEGTGMGLFIVKKIIENNSGKIAVTSRINHGSKFTISFPADIIVTSVEIDSSH